MAMNRSLHHFKAKFHSRLKSSHQQCCKIFQYKFKCQWCQSNTTHTPLYPFQLMTNHRWKRRETSNKPSKLPSSSLQLHPNIPPIKLSIPQTTPRQTIKSQLLSLPLRLWKQLCRLSTRPLSNSQASNHTLARRVNITCTK